MKHTSCGATTFSTMTFTITTLSIRTFTIMTLSILYFDVTISIIDLIVTLSKKDIQHNDGGADIRLRGHSSKRTFVY